jgi:lauroyl/myristoyl acyltransferase
MPGGSAYLFLINSGICFCICMMIIHNLTFTHLIAHTHNFALVVFLLLLPLPSLVCISSFFGLFFKRFHKNRASFTVHNIVCI